jgi:hypothetical protein
MGFRLRQKINLSAATVDRLAPLPNIPGIEGAPIVEEGPPEPDIPEVKYNLWSVRIENVDGRGRQLWVDEFHFEGDIHFKGAFFLRPKRWLWVGPAQATILSGSAIIGDKKLLEGIAGSVDCTVPPFDPRPPTGMEFFRFISGNVRMDANIPNTRAFDYYARIRGSPTVFDGGMGQLHLDGTLRSGVARPLNVSVDMREIVAERAAWQALGSLQVSGKTEADGPSEWIARVEPFELRHAAEKSAVVHGSELRVDAITDELDVSKPMPAFDIHADLPSAQVPNLRIINALLSSPGKLHIDGGEASIVARCDANSGTNQASGDVEVSGRGISAHEGELHFGGRLNLNAHVAKMILNSGDVDVSSALIDARNVTLRDSNATVTQWWSRVETHNAKFRPDQRVPVDVTFTARLQNATPILALSKRTPSVPGWITRFLAGGEVKASGRLKAGDAFVELSHLEARTGLLNVEGHYRERNQAKTGAFRVSAGPLSVGIEIKNDETNIVLIGSDVEPPLKVAATTVPGTK